VAASKFHLGCKEGLTKRKEGKIVGERKGENKRTSEKPTRNSNPIFNGTPLSIRRTRMGGRSELTDARV